MTIRYRILMLFVTATAVASLSSVIELEFVFDRKPGQKTPDVTVAKTTALEQCNGPPNSVAHSRPFSVIPPAVAKTTTVTRAVRLSSAGSRGWWPTPMAS